MRLQRESCAVGLCKLRIKWRQIATALRIPDCRPVPHRSSTYWLLTLHSIGRMAHMVYAVKAAHACFPCVTRSHPSVLQLYPHSRGKYGYVAPTCCSLCCARLNCNTPTCEFCLNSPTQQQ